MFQKIYHLFFTNRTMGQTVLKNTTWLGIGTLVSGLFKIVIVVYAARVLGASGYGVFSYALALAGFLSLLPDMGINLMLTRELSIRPELRTKYFSTVFFIRSALLILVYVILALLLPHFINIPEAIPLLSAMALMVVFDGFRSLGMTLVRAREQMEWEAGINIFTSIAIVVASVVAISYRASPTTLAFSYALGSGLGLIATGYVVRDYIKEILVNYTPQLTKRILSFVWPLAIINSLGAVLTYADSIFLGWMRTPTELGFYSAAQKPVQIFLAIPALLGISLFPIFSRLVHRQDPKMKSIAEQSILLSLLIAIPLTTGLFFLRRPLVLLLYGQDYLGSVAVLGWLSFVIVITFPAVIVSYIILAHNMQRQFIIQSVIGALMIIGLGLYMIPRWGAVGAAMAAVASQGVTYGFIYYVVRQRLRLAITRALGKIVAATGLMGISIVVLDRIGTHLYLTTALAIIVYLAALWLLREPWIERLKHTLLSSD
ncbi:MAG: oligosaccharide flippase family protein [Patescibacteria group bacterium]